METFILTIALIVSTTIMVLIVLQVDDDIKEIKKRLDDIHKEINKKQKL